MSGGAQCRLMKDEDKTKRMNDGCLTSRSRAFFVSGEYSDEAIVGFLNGYLFSISREMGEKRMKHKVQYYETDMMAITHHSNYIRWMEEARVDLMDQIGYPYSRMEAEGVLCVVKSLQVNFLKPCTFGDDVDITIGVKDFNGVIITLIYEMKVKGIPVFTGTSEHVFLNREGKFVRMKKAMPEFCAAIEHQMKKL